jgi:hypothetical protein
MGTGVCRGSGAQRRAYRVLKQKDFARWQLAEALPDAALCKAVHEMELGLVDADLGGMLFKKRIARAGQGKRGAYRAVLSARIGNRYVFLHGFAKRDVGNICRAEAVALRMAGKAFLSMSAGALIKACADLDLMEVCCESHH